MLSTRGSRFLAAYGFDISSCGYEPGMHDWLPGHAADAAVVAEPAGTPADLLISESTRGSALLTRSELSGPVVVGAGPLELKSILPEVSVPTAKVSFGCSSSQPGPPSLMLPALMSSRM